MKRCIVAADDFAYNAAVDDAILALIDAGVVTATSCLTTSPRWPQAARRVDPGLRVKADFGVHLDLTEFAPFTAHHALLVAGCYARLIDVARLRDSIQCQLQRFEDQLHSAPDYIDGHRHVHQLPVVRDVLIELLAKRYASRLPWVRISRARADAGWKGRFIGGLGSAGLAAACHGAGVTTSSHLIGWYGFEGGAAAYQERVSTWLARAVDGDVLMCHPASRLDALDRIGAARVAEFEVLSGPWWRACLERHGVRSIRGAGCFAA
jgi:chitin disaccharide deacetylase